MRVVEETEAIEKFEDIVMREKRSIFINGEQVAEFMDGEPEDNNMSRNFADVDVITSLMAKAHTAGKNGEPFHLEFEDSEED